MYKISIFCVAFGERNAKNAKGTIDCASAKSYIPTEDQEEDISTKYSRIKSKIVVEKKVIYKYANYA